MKKLFVNGCIALLGVMLVFAFTACKTEVPDTKSGKASLSEVSATWDEGEEDPEKQEVQAELMDVITAKWADIDPEEIDEANLGFLVFNTGTYTAVYANEQVFVFEVPASGKAAKSTVTYAVLSEGEVSAFAALSVGTTLKNDDVVFFRVVSENKKLTVHYAVKVSGLQNRSGPPTPSTDVTFTGGKLGDSTETFAVNNQQVIANGDATLEGLLEDPTKIRTYTLPTPNNTGDVTIQVNRPSGGTPGEKGNVDKVISWAVQTGATDVTEADFVAFDKSGTGALTAIASTTGLQDGNKFFIKVVAGDGETTRYYGWTIESGRVAVLNSVTLGGEAIDNLGEPGATWDDAELVAGVFDYQGSTPLDGFTLAVSGDGTITYAKVTGTGEPTFGPLPAAGAFIQIASEDFLYFKVQSLIGSLVKVYKVKVTLKQGTRILYGQPVINWAATPGDKPDIDPLWDELPFSIDIRRINTAETGFTTPPHADFSFLNTVDGTYAENGYGHTAGVGKAFWDDGGLYVYGQISFKDYYANQAAKDNGTVTAKTTAQITAAIAGSSAHLFDGLEMFTNERYQTYKEGNYGIQYRVSPSGIAGTQAGSQGATGSFSRITGNLGTTDNGAPIVAFRNSNKYVSWIDKDANGKETGFSVIAYIPWYYKDIAGSAADVSDVFDTTTGDVKTTGETAGPTVGFEFQLNAITTPGSSSRAAILTWNGVTGQSYGNVKYYGDAELILGAGGTAKRHARDPITVTFDVDGGEPTIPNRSVGKTTAIGAIPTVTKTNYDFGGWYLASDTDFSGDEYDENTIILATATSPLALKAKWTATSNPSPEFTEGLLKSVQFNRLDTIATPALDGTATIPGGGTPTYQWYSVANDLPETAGTAIATGGTGATYTPTAVSADSINYYYVVASNGAASIRSKTVRYKVYSWIVGQDYVVDFYGQETTTPQFFTSGTNANYFKGMGLELEFPGSFDITKYDSVNVKYATYTATGAIGAATSTSYFYDAYLYAPYDADWFAPGETNGTNGLGAAVSNGPPTAYVPTTGLLARLGNVANTSEARPNGGAVGWTPARPDSVDPADNPGFTFDITSVTTKPAGLWVNKAGGNNNAKFKVLELRFSGFNGPVDWTVTFDSNTYGTVTAAVPPTAQAASATANTAVISALPTPPVLTAPWDAGVTFGGWNTKADGTGTAVDATTVIKDNITVYAKWIFADGGIAFDNSDGDKLIHTAPVTATSKDDPYDTGTPPGQLQGTWNDRNTINLDGSVTFARNNAQGTAFTQYAGGTVRYLWPHTGLPAGQEIEDYDFVVLDYVYTNAGVDTGATALSVLSKMGKTDGDYSGGYGFVTTNQNTLRSMNRVPLKLSGYEEGGIALQRNSNGGTIKFLKATFTKGTRSSIAFDCNWTKDDPENPGTDIPGEAITSIQAVEGVAILNLPTPTPRAGMKFTGWNTAADGTGTTVTNATSMPVGGYAKLYAQWISQVAAAPILVDFTTAQVAGVNGTVVATKDSETGISSAANVGGDFSWTGYGFSFKVTIPDSLPLSNWDKISFDLISNPDAAWGGGQNATYKNMNIAAAATTTALEALLPLDPETGDNTAAYVSAHVGNRIAGLPATIVMTIDKNRAPTALTGEIVLAFIVKHNPGGGYKVSNFKIYQD